MRFGMPVCGAVAPIPVPRRDGRPAVALQRAVARVLDDDSPCYVAFSGGCDSSLVLAAAVAACREVGRADPVPVTFRYRTAESDERSFQELVVRRLGLTEWVIFDLGDDADLLSPESCDELRDGGALWPPVPLTRAHVLRRLEPGLWLNGEGGDAVLGPRRVSPLSAATRRWAHRPWRPPVGLLRPVVAELAPRARRVRAHELALAETYGAEWLHLELRRQYLHRAAMLASTEPLRPSQWFGHYLSRPHVTIGHASLRQFKARFGLRWEAPLVDPEFLGSLRGAVGWHQYRGRRHLLRTYFADLLPDEIIDRRTKASFNTAVFGAHTRAFAERWDGTGAPDGVDAAWLRQHWRSSKVSAGTAPLLHHVWLASEGARVPERDTPCR